MKIDKRKLHSVNETAVLKDCTVTYIYNLIYQNKIKFQKIGGMYFIKGTEIEKLINKT